MISTTRCDTQKEKVDGVTQARKRELQVVYAIGQQCKSTAEKLCQEMEEKRSELNLAIEEYKQRKAKLVDLEKKLHDRLALMLRNRSAAEFSAKKVRDYAENELKAQRTASTVRAYLLDERWCQLHDRYRGFAIDVLDGNEPTAKYHQQQLQPSLKIVRRRLFAVVDKFSAQYRRESQRTSRSLHTLMAGYLRETGTALSTENYLELGSGGKSNSYRQALLILNHAEPKQVLVKLRVMQEECAWIAERVRRRTDSSFNAVDSDRNVSANNKNNDVVDIKGLQLDLLSKAHHRVATGRDYLQKIHELMNRAILDVEQNQTKLRKLLFKTCSVCNGRKLQINTVSHTMVEIAGQLELSCFALFSRLDRFIDDSQQRNRSNSETATHDVVTSCLHAIQTNRMITVHQACDIAYRVDIFCKAITRLLLATTVLTPNKLTDSDRHHLHNSSTNILKRRVIRNNSNKISLERDREVTSSRMLQTPRKVHDKLNSTSLEPQQKKLSCTEPSVQVSTDNIVVVTMLYPPSINRRLNTYE